MQKSIDEIVSLLVNSGQVSRKQIVGCSVEEIEFFETTINVRLPAVYKSFLMEMGESLGHVLSTEKWTLKDLTALQEQVWEWVKGDNEIIVPPRAFFYYSHAGYEFAFFELGNGDDPRALVVSDSLKKPVQYDENLSGGLYQIVEQDIHTRNQLAARHNARK